MTKTMNDILGLDEAKCREIVDIKEKYIKGELTFEEAREIILQRFDSVTPQEFAFGEQMLKDDGIDDETMHEKWMTSSGFRWCHGTGTSGIAGRPPYPFIHGGKSDHPRHDSRNERAFGGEIYQNRWLEVYDRLKEYIKHITRKHNQLFPYLEQKGFDRPTLIMWTFDDHVKKQSSAAQDIWIWIKKRRS